MVNVRLAQPADRAPAVELVRRLLAELGGTPPPAADIAPVFDGLAAGRGDGFIVIAEDEMAEDAGGLIAVCTVSFLTALRSRGRYAIIQEMFVEPAARSGGTGGAVLRFALQHAAASGCSLVELGTPFDGSRQIEFYRRAGFTEVGARLRWRP